MTIFLASIAYNNNVSLPDCGLPIVSLIMKSVHSETKFVKICLTHTLFCAWGINCWFVIPPTGCKMWLFGAKSGPCTNDCVGVEQNGIWKKKTTTASLNYSRCSRTPTNKFGLYSSTSDYTSFSGATTRWEPLNTSLPLRLFSTTPPTAITVKESHATTSRNDRIMATVSSQIFATPSTANMKNRGLVHESQHLWKCQICYRAEAVKNFHFKISS